MLFGRFRWAAFFLWIIFTLLFIPYFFSGVGVPSFNPNVNYGFDSYINLVTGPLIWLFAIGAFCGLIFRCKRITFPNLFLANLTLFITASLVIFQYSTRINADHGVLGWGLSLIPFCICFIVGLKTRPLKICAPLIYLGDISFSLYLFHPIIQEGFDYWTNGAFAAFGLPPGFSAFFLTTVLSIAVASCSYQYIEKWISKNLIKSIS
jgi:peptidoglycan/LPS O-acetylase OafA/YrhL